MALRVGLTWLMLMVLLALTMASSLFLTGLPGLLTGLAIAVCKAMLVFAIFMDLTRQPGLMRVAALGATIWLFILFFLVGIDYMTR